MAEQFERGDEVVWNTSQGPTHGTVEKKLTHRTHIKDHAVDASEDRGKRGQSPFRR